MSEERRPIRREPIGIDELRRQLQAYRKGAANSDPAILALLDSVAEVISGLGQQIDTLERKLRHELRNR